MLSVAECLRPHDRRPAKRGRLGRERHSPAGSGFEERKELLGHPLMIRELLSVFRNLLRYKASDQVVVTYLKNQLRCILIKFEK